MNQEATQPTLATSVFACEPLVTLLLPKLDEYTLARFSAVNKATRDIVRANEDAQELLYDFKEQLLEEYLHDYMERLESTLSTLRPLGLMW